MVYDHARIEKKWQDFWQKNKTFATPNPPIDKPKKYILGMFPYPSGAGLHVGHPKSYTATDILTRYYHAKGYNVLHPMGFDAFGLPAENYAIKTGTHPAITTAENIATFTTQLQALGYAYDWDRVINTTDPNYYRWTQWIFLELFKKGLAYEQDLPINYCPSCKTGLANEEVLADNTCERCGTVVERRPIRQWVLKITDYADRLVNDLDDLDWPESLKDMQRNWIGRSEGCEFEMKKSDDSSKSIRVYTTRVDTVYGMTYAVMAPDHPNVWDFITEEKKSECETYIADSLSHSDQDRTNESKEKTGVFTGSYVINPFSGQSVPLWIADYVLGHYGTGAVMAVPAHDERDFAFAKKYDLPIIKTIISPEEYTEYALLSEKISDAEVQLFQEEQENIADRLNEIEDVLVDNKPYCEEGVVCIVGPVENEDLLERVFDAKDTIEAREIFIQKAETEGFGQRKVNYKLRDWLFSRQRYWGEPIPLIHIDFSDFECLPREKGSDAWIDVRADGEYLMIDQDEFSKIYPGLNTKIVIDSRLPVTLPELENYQPAGDGQSPLVKAPQWVNVKLAKNLSGKRETNTMPQWGGSCWYYLRYMDPKNPDAFVGREALDYWQNVDEYVGGTEHAVLHLLYARFWHKVLYDIGVVPTKEPFQKLVNQGMILAYAYERMDGGLVAVDLVEEKDGRFFIIQTGEEVKRIVAKMSKSLKNTANPIDIVDAYGADTLRLYIMSMGDFRDTAPWNTDAIIGMSRFLDKISQSYTDNAKNPASDDIKSMKLLHKTIKKVSEDIVAYKMNTAISALIILMNAGIPTDPELRTEWQSAFAILLHPFAPHMAEELFEKMGNVGTIFDAKWPEYDEFMLVDDEVTIAIQVNGKLRGTLTCFHGVSQEEVSELAMNDPNIAKWLDGKTLVKEIFIANKMLSIVVK